MNDNSKVGIKQQIESATTKAQVLSLLNKARTFKNAHPKTLRRCERIAAEKLLALESE